MTIAEIAAWTAFAAASFGGLMGSLRLLGQVTATVLEITKEISALERRLEAYSTLVLGDPTPTE